MPTSKEGANRRANSLDDHLLGVAELAEAVALELGLPAAEVVRVRLAAALHNVGKMAISADGLAGSEIPLASRIIFVCDAFDAMTSERSYTAARTAAKALAELRRNAGTQFDPVAVEALARVVDQQSGTARLASTSPSVLRLVDAASA
jgi:HD-GYP domain-containing protein (c-di-GMP phosphodiesterase class II)